MSKLIKRKKKEVVDVKRFLASLVNTPWLVEEAWLSQLYNLFVDTVNIDLEALKVYESQKLEGAKRAEFRGSVASVPVHGPIFARSNFLTDFLGIGCVLGDLVSDIQKALDDSSIEDIVLDIDSPGGTVTGVNEAAKFIAAAKEQKKITAYVGGSGASAAYWLASAASEIVLDETSRVGSIGVVAGMYAPNDDDDYIEIVNSASPKKRPDPKSDEGKAAILEEIDALADVFIGVVAKNRNVSVETVKKDFGQGGIKVGEQAIAVGMADRIDTYESLVMNLKGDGEPGNNFIEGEKMDLEKLKADFPDLYASVVQTAQAEIQKKLDAALTENTTLKAENGKLKDDLEKETEEKTAVENRVAALEKADSIRAAKDIRHTAESVMAARLNDSNIPDSLQAKVKQQVDHNKFVADGVLDVEAFTKAFDEEVSDWEKQLESVAPVSGVRTPPKGDHVNGDNDVVSRLGNYIGIKEE
jgi:ClpP class serine protease